MTTPDLAALIRDGAYEVLRHTASSPDPGDPKYIKHSAQVIGAERFNDLQRPVRRVTISGVHLGFDTTDSRGVVREYNGKEDIRELYIIADTVVVSRALRFPQTDVFILCRELQLKGPDAVIDTTPRPLDKDYRELLDKNGRNGPKAGNITLYVSKLNVDTPGLRFIARGAAGQEAEEGEISTTSNRRDLPLITKELWEGDKGFSYAHRHVRHESGVGGNLEFYTSDMPTSVCDWETFQRMCGKSITYVKFTNEAWSSFWHGDTQKETVFELGTTELPGEGGAGLPPGKPGTGGAGGNLTSTVQIDPKLRDLTGGSSAPRHPGTPGGAGGTPQTAYWVFFEGKPKGTGSDGGEHAFSARTERKEASVGKPSGPGPQADKPRGDNGQDVALWSQPNAKDKCAAGWVTPLLLNIVIQYAKDVAAAEQSERAQAVLKPYFDALAGRTNEAISSGFPEEVVGGLNTMAQLRDEATRLTARFDQHLDSFGNPPGWVPNLTLTGAVGAYDAVRDIALKELYGAYYLEKAWKAKEARANALKQLIDVLIEKTQQLKAQMIDTQKAIMQRRYVAPADPTAVRTLTVGDLTGGGKSSEKVSFDDMSLLERLRSLVAQMDALETKRKEIEKRLRAEADKDTTTKLQWEAAQAGLKISSAVLKALPLPPPYEQAAAAFGGLLDVTSAFMEHGGDDAAFAELKKQVTDFTDTNQEQLVKVFTSSMDNELSTYNDEIENLEQAAKDTQKEKNALKPLYDAKIDAANKEREAAIKALADRTQQRLRERQPPPDPMKSNPVDFNTAIATRALEITKGAGSTKTLSDEYNNKKTELGKKSTAIETNKAELEKKVKSTTKAKETRAESTKKNIENVKKVVDGIEQIAKAVNKLTVSETQLNTKWDEALAKITSKDAEFQTYLTNVTYLNEQKKLVVGRLIKLLNDLQDQRQQIARNLVAINELRLQYAKGGTDDLDHSTLLYIQGMREDAHRRLTTFLYYVTRAYEYYTVSPYNEFYADARKTFEDLRVVLANPNPNLAGIFDPSDSNKAANETKLKALITAPTDPILSPSDFALLKGVYEKPLRDMGIRMLDELASGRERKIEEREKYVTLRSDDLQGLNARIKADLSARMTINLARLDQINGGDEKQRLGGIKVVKAVIRKLGARFPNDITFKVTHLGRSIVCYQGKFFAFEPQAGTDSGRRARGVTFETNGTPAKMNPAPDATTLTLTSEALKQPDSKAQETLVSKLLGSAKTGQIDLSQFRPGAFSDFLLTVEFTPRDCTIQLDEVELVVMMEKGNTDTSAELITVFNDRDLVIDISTSRSDRSGRSRAIGNYMGIYNDDEIEKQPLVISVPAEYGAYRHTGWNEGVKASSKKPNSCEVSRGTRVIAKYEANR
jgi:hypothetical protein